MKYEFFIPSAFRADSKEDDNEEDSGTCMVRQPKKKLVTEESPLFYDYDVNVNPFIAHLRRVHPSLKPLMMDIEGMEDKVSVKINMIFENSFITSNYR